MASLEQPNANATQEQPTQQQPRQAPAFKSIGIGSAYQSTMRVVTHSFNAVGNVSSALDATSKAIEMQAWLGYAKKSQDMLLELGATVDTPQQAIATTEALLTSLRGY